MPVALTVDRLQLTFSGALGHEHRVKAISARAAAILFELMEERDLALGMSGALRLDRLATSSVAVELGRMPDEDIARLVAEAAYDSVAARLRLQRRP